MESEGVSLPLIHKHLMVPWNHLGKGDCCRQFKAITDGYLCEECDYFIHKECSESSEYIQHPSHPAHALRLRNIPDRSCDLCGKRIRDLTYSCEICDFDIDLHCAKYPPPEVIDTCNTHRHKLTLSKESIEFKCAICGQSGRDHQYPYECNVCDLTFFHVDCVWHPLEIKHPLEYKTIDAGERVSLPWLHRHFMIPLNDMRKGDCCGHFKAISAGYYCKRCDFFVHKKCGEEPSKSIQHPYHSLHPLWFQITSKTVCDFCWTKNDDGAYSCHICFIDIGLDCVRNQPPDVFENFKAHHHKLTFVKGWNNVECHAKCNKYSSRGLFYECRVCDLYFHLECVWQPLLELEVNHPYHSVHPLKLLLSYPPEYSDGKCHLCGRKIDDIFYHCSSCNFSLDMRCVLNPPLQSFTDLKAHDHQLTLLPRLDSFSCNACGLKGDRSPYACFQCGFMIHQDCLNLPLVININRHDHRVSRTSVLGVVNSVCGVCRKKVDWSYGGYKCQRCPHYVVHSKCATRRNVWNGEDLVNKPEEIEDLEPYVVIDDNTIQHFSHKEHYLSLRNNGVRYEDNKWCMACNHPIGIQSFYGCLDCDFVLHKNCAELPQKKWHVLHNEKLTLVTSTTNNFWCSACSRVSNGFMYKEWIKELDVCCSSIFEPFVHPSHPQHPLYYIPRNGDEICNGCNSEDSYLLKCIEDGCGFALGFDCGSLPQVVKHRVDDDLLSLCYGVEEASGKYWCDICEKETNPKTWFYTSKDHRASLHIECVLGDCGGLMPRSTIDYRHFKYEVVLNNTATRPFCNECMSRCMYPIILKQLGASHIYYCSYECTKIGAWR